MNVLKSWGYQPEPLPLTRAGLEGASFRYLAGSDSARRAELQEAFSGEYDAVWASRGGFGMTRLMPELLLESWPKIPFFGFSDASALLNPMAQRGLPAVHAPVVQTLSDHINEESRNALQQFLLGAPPPLNGTRWSPGDVRGHLLGGNLCVLTSLCGTPHQLDARGAIVLIEEVSEAPYRVDRLLTQLLQSGSLTGAKALVLGKFTNCEAPNTAGYQLEEILKEALLPLGLPILADVPVGHGADNHPILLGPVQLTGDTLFPQPS